MLLRILPLILSAAAAHAQPIQLVVDSASGAGLDRMGRMIAERLAKRVGPVVVENRGAGAQAVKTAAPDGHTLLFASDQLLLQQVLAADPALDLVADFAPVILAATVDLFIVAPPDGVPGSVLELVRLAKEKPGALSYGTASTGTPQHLGIELLKQRAAIDVQHVPYGGAAPMLAGVAAGRVQVAVTGYPALQPYLGKLRILAVASPTRSPLQPAVPTLREAGVADAEVEGYFYFLAPAGTPAAVVARLNTELNAVLALEELRADLAPLGITTSVGSPHRLAALLRLELAKWQRVVRTAGIIRP